MTFCLSWKWQLYPSFQTALTIPTKQPLQTYVNVQRRNGWSCRINAPTCTLVMPAAWNFAAKDPAQVAASWGFCFACTCKRMLNGATQATTCRMASLINFNLWNYLSTEKIHQGCPSPSPKDSFNLWKKPSVVEYWTVYFAIGWPRLDKGTLFLENLHGSRNISYNITIHQ